MTKNNWREIQVVIGGASSGLGFHLAQALASQGSHLHLIARDAGRLEKARELMLRLGAASVKTYLANLGEVDAAEKLQSLEQNLGSLERGLGLLINAVGKSDRGMLVQPTDDQWLEMFRVNVLSAIQLTRVCLPALVNAGGCIVNIGSLASKVAPAGMGTYPATKFALAALTQQWRLELASQHVHAMLVCPGPIERDDAGVRYEHLAQERGLSAEQAKPAGGAKLKSIDPKWLSMRILQGASRRELEIVIPGKVRWLATIYSLWPALGERILKSKFRT